MATGLLGSPALGAARHAGVLVLGIGDAAASVVGSRVGRRRWPGGGGKTVEGSAAAVASMLVAVVALRWAEGVPLAAGWAGWAALACCVALACALEAFTAQMDNLFLPLYFHALLLGVAAREEGWR